MEIQLQNGRYTWSREGCSASGSLLDRFFINEEWDEAFEHTRVSRKARTFSDYFPLFLEAVRFYGGLPLSGSVIAGC